VTTNTFVLLHSYIQYLKAEDNSVLVNTSCILYKMNDILVVSICIPNSSAYQLRDVSDDRLKHVADLVN
jgi:hypothetical protein